MIRHASKKPCSLKLIAGKAIVPQAHQSIMRPASSLSGSGARIHNSCQSILIPSKRRDIYPNLFTTAQRKLSDQPPNKNTDGKKESGGESSNEIVLTPGQKVVAASRLSMWAGVAALAVACSYYIGKELIPTKMSPNSIFDNAFSKIKDNEVLKRRFGEKLKAYGRDHNGKREGRRNFIENSEYKDKEDGSKRVRVRFNLEGEHGKAFVFAEVSNDMPSGEFVYLMVQDRRNGQVINIIDNRSALMAKRMAGDNDKGKNAFADLLGVKK